VPPWPALMGALIIEQGERWLTDKQYLNMTLLEELRKEESRDEREAA